jgi:NADPH:quinone reductase-like Zn-dependent oxidoreductase
MSAGTLPANMKAVVFDTETNTLALETQPVPTPGKDELLIKVHSVAVTKGELTWGAFVKWPKKQVTTYDVTGTVVAAPSDSSFKVGDEVYGRVDATRQGSAREYATILESETAMRPKNLTVEEAAAVPMSALTAWQALFTQAGLKEPDETGTAGVEKGKRVLITAASGGVGMLGVQFAKLSGATVVVSCGAKNRDFMLGLGADDVIDYKTTTLTGWVGNDESKKFDVVFDCAGGKTLEEAWFVVKEGGVLVNIAPVFKEPDSGVPKGVKGWFFIMTADGKMLSRISEFIERGQIQTMYDSVFSFEDFQKAFDRTASGQTKGKVVLKPSL